MRTTSGLGLVFIFLAVNCGGVTDPNLEDYVGRGGTSSNRGGGAGHRAGGAGYNVDGGGPNATGDGGHFAAGGAGHRTGGSGGGGGASGSGGGGKAGGSSKGIGGSKTDGGIDAGRGGLHAGGSAGMGGTKVDGGVGGPSHLDAAPEIGPDSDLDAEVEGAVGPDAPGDGPATTTGELAARVAGKIFTFVKNRDYVFEFSDGATNPDPNWFTSDDQYQATNPVAAFTVVFGASFAPVTLYSTDLDSGAPVSCYLECPLDWAGDTDAGIPMLFYRGPLAGAGGTGGHLVVWQSSSGELEAEVQQYGSTPGARYSWRGVLTR